MAGAPEGNNNSSRDNRLWRNTINRAIKQGDADRLRRIAETLLQKAEEGEAWAIKELGDRLDGKALQGHEVTGTDGGPIENKWTVTFVNPTPKGDGDA